jgi:hypothetical protein
MGKPFNTRITKFEKREFQNLSKTRLSFFFTHFLLKKKKKTERYNLQSYSTLPHHSDTFTFSQNPQKKNKKDIREKKKKKEKYISWRSYSRSYQH